MPDDDVITPAPAQPLAADPPAAVRRAERGARGDEPPVVARLVVEVRSDGSLTIARGALEDLSTGQRTMVEARGTTPLQLALSLTQSLLGLPAVARRAARALLPGSPRSRRRPE